ncbi:probable Chitin deacetylase [Serendipita indica DSM 11827]|uniref:chitin deacetylase n=1 Tax=Serendipita indica (strain DSM 11827) TaxID=1109443 RepID=G4TWC8_SERID|nr:probable Chitin deacetylase [Serendipita indica DSM 11827]
MIENVIPGALQTFAPGTASPIDGAPTLPSLATFDPKVYPPLDTIPPTDTDQVKEWVDAIDWSTIPQIPPTNSKACDDPKNQQALAEAGPNGRCWWSCGQCLRDVDITTCANQMDYGHGYDDGPVFYTNKILSYLNHKGYKATFYVVGSRVISYPQIVQYQYMTGHELSVHTWSHAAIYGKPELNLGLTSLTNEQIVAELGWTRKAIKDITGVSPTTFRPPYGDIDDRVRAIGLAMGMMPIVWTSQPNPNGGEAIQWDSGDWKVHGNQTDAPSNQANFNKILDMSSNLDHGVVVLQHDQYVEEVDLSIGFTLPYLEAHSPKFNIKPVMQCQNRPLADAFEETNTNKDNPALTSDEPVQNRRTNLGYPASHPAASVSVTLSLSTASNTGTATHTRSATQTPPNGGNSGAASRTVGSASLAAVVGWATLMLL